MPKPSSLSEQRNPACEARILQCSDVPLGGSCTIAGQSCNPVLLTMLASLGLAALPSCAKQAVLQQCPTYW